MNTDTITRGQTAWTLRTDLVTESCYSCGVWFAMARPFYEQRLRDGRNFHCPAGHQQHYTENDTTRLRKAEAKAQHLADQLQAAENDAENTRRTLARERHRFANGVCPCCQRSFSNVRRHMESQHPDYDIARVDGPGLAPAATKDFHCSCSRKFATYRGLRIHQSHSSWGTHKTKV